VPYIDEPELPVAERLDAILREIATVALRMNDRLLAENAELRARLTEASLQEPRDLARRNGSRVTRR